MPGRPIPSMLCSLLLVVAGAAGATTTTRRSGSSCRIRPPIRRSRICASCSTGTRSARRVIRQAENQSKNLVHEVIVGRDDGAKELPMDAKHGRENESRVQRPGEISDLAPGKTGKLYLISSRATMCCSAIRPATIRREWLPG